jgi:glycine/D-amino acid oxidase-like deaminating enzyme
VRKGIPQSTDVVICGAGMAGICTAHCLAKRGLQDIVLVDRQAPLSLTSDKSAETFRVWWPGEVNADKFGLLNRSIDLIEELMGESGGMLNMNSRGHCHATTAVEKISEFQDTVQEYARLGLGPLRVHESKASDAALYVPPGFEEAEGAPQGVDLLLDQGAIRDYYPYLSDKTSAILHDRRSGYFSGHTLGMYLLEQAKGLGVREVRAEVVSVDQDNQGVCAVQVLGESGLEAIMTRRFVNAAGPFVGRVAAMLQVELPVETGLWEKIVIDDYLGVVPRSAPVLVLHDKQHLEWSEEEKQLWCGDEEYRWFLDELPEGVYMRPEGGMGSRGFLIGWAYNECPFGVKVDRGREAGRGGAGAACQPQWEPQLSKEFPELALRGAVKLVPGLKQYIGKMHKLMHDGGYYVRTEGNLPLIGPMGVDGAFIVQHDGMVMAGCAAGALCAAWVTGSDLPDYADGLSFKRYDNPRFG